MCSVKTVMPFGSRVKRTSSIMDIQPKNWQKVMSLRILARGKPAAKWSQNGRWLGVRLLDSTWIIGGKCELSNGSGKSPGLNQFAFCGYGETAFAVFDCGEKS